MVDGDTLEVESIGEIRLIGVDTPELYHPLKPVQFFAKEASDFGERAGVWPVGQAGI